MRKSLFIDGEAGTTGLEIFRRLHERADLEIIRLPPELRKDAAARRAALNECDLAVLCLPDDAAREAVALIENPKTRVLDASTAFRTAPDWTYGFAEMVEGQAARIAGAHRVSNPGCYATGGIALLRPLLEAGLLAREAAVTLPSVSGYTGGGKSLIAEFENPQPGDAETGFYEYGLNFAHKHLPEITVHSGLTHAPIFVPSVGRFARGMLVNLPLHASAIGGAKGAALLDVYARHYATPGQVLVQPLHELTAKDGGYRLEADALAGSDLLHIHVYWNEASGQALAVAQFDNLGKGACGAALQNIGLMLDIPDLGAE